MTGTGGEIGSWSARYGAKHRWVRLIELPAGLAPPKRVRVYKRADHFLLNWWDPRAGKSLYERVNGDLLAALTRARQVDERVSEFKTAGAGKRARVGHTELVSGFVADLGRRAEAGEVAPRTVDRYASALRHYLDYCERPEVSRTYPTAARVNREFRLGFAAFLSTLPARGRRAGGHGFVLDAVRAMYEWGADPDRGGLLPDGFRNVFRLAAGRKPVFRGDPLAPPDITLAMALDLVAAADQFQLRLFGSILLFGLRAAEPCTLFAEHLRDGWLRVPCVPELDLLTKGRRDKTLPLIADLDPFWELFASGRKVGLILERRSVVEGRETASLRGCSLPGLIAEYHRRLATNPKWSATERLAVRDAVLRDAGWLTYDHVEGEFRGIAARLGWPRAATVKDLRHLFATTMNDAVMPDAYRRYLMGHSPGKAAVVAYTHLAALRNVYAAAVRREWEPLIAAINARVKELDGSNPPE
jgi:hypothetical protein